MSNYNTSNVEGIDFTQTYAAVDLTNHPEIPAWPFAVGTRVNATNGAEYVFVSAGSTITANQVVGIKEDTLAADPLTKAMADAGREVAIAPVAIASGSAGWVQTRGSLSATLKNGCLPNVALYTSASAGMLFSTSASQTRVYGIRATATAASSGAAVACYVSNLTV